MCLTNESKAEMVVVIFGVVNCARRNQGVFPHLWFSLPTLTSAIKFCLIHFFFHYRKFSSKCLVFLFLKFNFFFSRQLMVFIGLCKIYLKAAVYFYNNCCLFIFGRLNLSHFRLWSTHFILQYYKYKWILRRLGTKFS